MTSSCTEKTALLLTYSDSARQYSEAVTELHERIGRLPRKEYQRMHRQTEDARLSVESARMLMEEHVRQHGC
jgi:hypothetical protein